MNQETELYKKFFGKEPKTSEVNFDYKGYDPNDVINQRLDHKTLSSVRDSNLKKAMMGINSLTDPTSMAWALPNEGLFGGLKAFIGGASALAGAGLGYAKAFSKDKEQTNLYNKTLGDDGYKDDVLKKRNMPEMEDGGEVPFGKWLEENPSVRDLDENMQRKLYDASMKSMNSGMSINNDLYKFPEPSKKIGQEPFKLPENFNTGIRDISADGKSNTQIPKLPIRHDKGFNNPISDTADGSSSDIISGGTEDILSGNGNEGNDFNSSTITHQGDPLGQALAYNSLYGLSMATNFFKQRSLESDYNEMKRKLGYSHNRFQEQDMVDAFGNYTVNSGVGNNFKLNKMVTPQSLGSTHYKKGGDTSAEKKKSIDYISKEDGGDVDGEPLKPIYVTDPNDPRLQNYNDSLISYNLNIPYKDKIKGIYNTATDTKESTSKILQANQDFRDKGMKFSLGFNRQELPYRNVSDGKLGAILYDFKNPVQPIIYKNTPNYDTDLTAYLQKEKKPFSFADRKKIAIEAGITDYVGTAKQNLALMGLLTKGEEIPSSLITKENTKEAETTSTTNDTETPVAKKGNISFYLPPKISNKIVLQSSNSSAKNNPDNPRMRADLPKGENILKVEIGGRTQWMTNQEYVAYKKQLNDLGYGLDNDGIGMFPENAWDSNRNSWPENRKATPEENNLVSYKEGGEYELSEKEIQKMIDAGYEFEYID